MRNVWKGLVVGGLTGVGAGAVLDLFGQGSRLARVAGGRAAGMAPRAADRIKSAAITGSARVQETDLPEQVRDHVRGFAHRLGEADTTDRAKERRWRARRPAPPTLATWRPSRRQAAVVRMFLPLLAGGGGRPACG